MGKAKEKDSAYPNCKKKGRTYRCRKKETFPTDESPLGGKKESRKEVNRVKPDQRLAASPWLGLG
jgi:hypothetical protein